MNRLKRDLDLIIRIDLTPKPLSEWLSITNYLLKIIETYSFDLHNEKRDSINITKNSNKILLVLKLYKTNNQLFLCSINFTDFVASIYVSAHFVSSSVSV